MDGADQSQGEPSKLLLHTPVTSSPYELGGTGKLSSTRISTGVRLHPPLAFSIFYLHIMATGKLV